MVTGAFRTEVTSKLDAVVNTEGSVLKAVTWSADVLVRAPRECVELVETPKEMGRLLPKQGERLFCSHCQDTELVCVFVRKQVHFLTAFP